ncbi:MAG: NAD(P)/FAD-dependent oxidoreductase [Proteobacteria bacterium]|nr:NAD(P)/FAD-dependent oxidoreductase [Pseudomonadota bacterium]
MTPICDVAIIGAGPYGLSLAAHLRARGVNFRIFGKALDTWRNHMPRGMLLKSEGFASSLSAPDAGSTLKSYCDARNIAFADEGLPVQLTLFNAYASWFRERYVPDLEETLVTSLSRDGEFFALETDNGERLHARQVVLATGITSFAHTPGTLRHLPGWAVSHSFSARDVDGLNGREVCVIGAGASAIDTAAELRGAGASVRIITRAQNIRFHSAPDPDGAGLMQQIKRPSSGIGPGWRSYFCANAPLLFHRLPENLRLRATKRHLGPAPGWFMRERVEGHIPMLLGRKIAKADVAGDRAVLELHDANGMTETIACDHVVCATGYHPALQRLPFLAPQLRDTVEALEDTPILSDVFESSLRGLYTVGPLAANSFGPLMRFMVGAEFTSPRLANHLMRRAGASQRRQAA